MSWFSPAMSSPPRVYDNATLPSDSAPNSPHPQSSTSTFDFSSLPHTVIRLIAFHLLHESTNIISIPISTGLNGSGSAVSPSLGPTLASPSLFSSRGRSASIVGGGSGVQTGDSTLRVPKVGTIKPLMSTCRTTFEALRFQTESKAGVEVDIGREAEEAVRIREGILGIMEVKRGTVGSVMSSSRSKRKRSSPSPEREGWETRGKRKSVNGASGNTSLVSMSVIDPSLLGSPERKAARRIASEDLATSSAHLYRHLYFETFDTAAILRRYGQESLIPGVQFRRRRTVDSDATLWDSPDQDEFDLLHDPGKLAEEYKERMALFRRMRYVVAHRSLDVVVDRGVGSGLAGLGLQMNGSVAGDDLREVVCRRRDVEGDLWRIWWMITEHDSRNISLLHTLGQLVEYLAVYHDSVVLADFKAPDYPLDSVERGLYSWICVRTGVDKLAESTPESLDEKLFLHKPFALACFKYPNLLGPWLFRHLPLVDSARSHEELNLISGPNPFMSELTPRSMSSKVVRFGREWEMVAPRQTDATALMLTRLLDRHPTLGTLHKVGLPSSARFKHGLAMPRDLQLSMKGKQAASPRARVNSVSEVTRSETVTSLDFDLEVRRSLTCLSPVDSPGLPALFFRNKLHGLWVGKYLYIDHQDYKRALLGNIRSMYEGPMGDEEQEFYLEESVINVRIDRVGGDGQALAAGFKVDMDDDELREDEELDLEQRGWEPCLDEDAPDKPGWTKEIILQGKGQSTWGPCYIYGRVRGWDGLITWRTDYGPLAVDKWLWRTYAHAGGVMLGRFRDCFTPENVRAYEGAVAMFKVDSPLHAERQRERLFSSRRPHRSVSTQSDHDAAAPGVHPSPSYQNPQEHRPTLPPFATLPQHHMPIPAPSHLPGMRSFLNGRLD